MSSFRRPPANWTFSPGLNAGKPAQFENIIEIERINWVWEIFTKIRTRCTSGKYLKKN